MYESSSEDGKQRPFICPCGKNYLSYPALFTHVKQKHNGNAPGQIIRPKSLNKRGRPRKSLSDLPNDFLPPLPDYKNSINRLFLSRGEQESAGSGEQEAGMAKPAGRISCDFIPPIPTSHLSIIKNYHSLPPVAAEPAERYQAPKDLSISGSLLERLKGVFAGLSSGTYLNTASLQALIKSNQCYQRARAAQRKHLRKVVGADKLELDLRTAVMQFLELAEDELSKREFKNLEVLMGLLLVFYLEMLDSQKSITTQNYIKHINSFTKNLLQEVYHEHYYRNVFAVEKQVAMQLLEVFHQWLLAQKLSHHRLQINPLFNVDEPEENSQSEGARKQRVGLKVQQSQP